MPFSGKPSKGCAPCRAKRTKCDLGLPWCTQCIRKNRVCTGYRNEQDLIFRHETPSIVRKAKRTNDERSVRSFTPDQSTSQSIHALQPSRSVAIDDEAVMHFFAHYNEKFFAKDQQHGRGGFDYVLPVYQRDMLSGGPVPEIIRASGLAAIGNRTGSPDLLVAARAKQVQVLGQLNKQIQDSNTRTSDSSILTCILLSAFENIICDSAQSPQAMTYHLRGAATLAEMRGAALFADDVGHGVYTQLRGFMLAHCLQTREPLPEFVLNFLANERIVQRDFEPGFYKLLARLCQIRSDHKNKGFVDANMARDAQQLMHEFEAWQPTIIDWQPHERPSPSAETGSSADDTYRFVWLATIWIFKHMAQILASDLVVEWARAQVLVSHESSAFHTLDYALNFQTVICNELRESIVYYLESFKNSQSSMRTIGGYGLLWPLYVLSTAASSTPLTMSWISTQAEKIAETFGIRQGKTMADFMRMYASSHAG